MVLNLSFQIWIQEDLTDYLPDFLKKWLWTLHNHWLKLRYTEQMTGSCTNLQEWRLLLSRPNSLTSIVCKTLEHILSARIILYAHFGNILCMEQHGFCKKNILWHTVNINSTMHDFVTSLNNRGQVDGLMPSY